MNEARRMMGREELATSSPPLLWGDEGKGRRWLSGQFAHAVASCPQPSQVLLALWTDEGNEIRRYRITVQRLYEFVLLVDISKLLTEKGLQLLGKGGGRAGHTSLNIRSCITHPEGTQLGAFMCPSPNDKCFSFNKCF